jgi:hypothetical protein
VRSARAPRTACRSSSADDDQAPSGRSAVHRRGSRSGRPAPVLSVRCRLTLAARSTSLKPEPAQSPTSRRPAGAAPSKRRPGHPAPISSLRGPGAAFLLPCARRPRQWKEGDIVEFQRAPGGRVAGGGSRDGSMSCWRTSRLPPRAHYRATSSGAPLDPAPGKTTARPRAGSRRSSQAAGGSRGARRSPDTRTGPLRRGADRRMASPPTRSGNSRLRPLLARRKVAVVRRQAASGAGSPPASAPPAPVILMPTSGALDGVCGALMAQASLAGVICRRPRRGDAPGRVVTQPSSSGPTSSSTTPP